MGGTSGKKKTVSEIIFICDKKKKTNQSRKKIVSAVYLKHETASNLLLNGDASRLTSKLEVRSLSQREKKTVNMHAKGTMG